MFRGGARRVNAFLPVWWAGEWYDHIKQIPLRNYRSERDLREHFWADIRAKLRWLYTGFPGDGDRNTNDNLSLINIGAAFLDNDRGITIYATPRARAGSCNKKADTYPILKGHLSAYRVLNPASMGGNCGLQCLRAANANMPSIKKIKEELNLEKEPGKGLTEEDLVRVGEKYGMKVRVFTDQSNEEHLWESLTSGFTCLYLSNDHYKLVLSKSTFYTCPICKRKLRSKDVDALNSHECSLKRIQTLTSHPNAEVARCDAAYDIETRSDFARANTYNVSLTEEAENGDAEGKDPDPAADVTVLPQVPTLICLAYKNPAGDTLKKTFFGKDCAKDFIEFLMFLHERYIYLDLYAHNGSRFDALFIMKAIKAHPELHKYANLDDAIIKGTRILSFKFLNHTFRGTENYLEGSLAKLCDSFKIKDAKLKEITINGEVWNTMDLCLMNPEMDPEQFIDFLELPENAEYKDAYIEYCLYDCFSLLEVWTKFKEQMLGAVIPTRRFPYLEQVFTRSATLPGTIMKVFKAVHSKQVTIPPKTPEGKEKRWYTKTYWCPTNQNKSVVKLISDAKLGGISHVAQPGLHIGEISLVDVKSLYPSVMLNCQYPDGAPIELFGDKDCRSFVSLGNMAIIRCSIVRMKTDCIADYPARTSNGLNWAASEIVDGALTSIDILRILRHGGDVVMDWGIGWTTSGNPFVPVISEATKIKVLQDEYKAAKDPRYNPVLREATKLSGNALFGKMLESSRNHSWKEFESFFDYSEFDPEGRYEVHQSNERFYIKVPDEQEIYPPLQFGVFILAHSRDVMQTYFDMVGRQNVIASETDSIHCYDKYLLRLRESNDPLYRIGDKYGNMVIEYNGTITKAMFLAKKCYVYLEVKPGAEKKKRCKGIATSCLTDDFYYSLYQTGKAQVDNMKLFRRNLFSDVATGVTIEYITKVVKQGLDVTYNEYRDGAICPSNDAQMTD
jgi:hypothetical protein